MATVARISMRLANAMFDGRLLLGKLGNAFLQILPGIDRPNNKGMLVLLQSRQHGSSFKINVEPVDHGMDDDKFATWAVEARFLQDLETASDFRTTPFA